MLMTPVREKLSHIAVGLNPTSVAPFRRILSDRIIVDYLKDAGYSWRDRVYTPLIVFWAMIVQALNDDHSCAYAVDNVMQWLRSRKAPGQRRNRKVPRASPITGSYCRARARLPLGLFSAMARLIAREFAALVPAENKLWGRDIYLVDATTASTPDTPELAEEFGKHHGGRNRSEFPFPIARLVALVSLTSGAVMDMAIGAFRTSEHALLETLYRGANWLRGAIIVGDSLYGCFAQLALMQMRGVDVVSRPQGARKLDMRQGRRLGNGQQLVRWKRPKKWPPWLARCVALPKFIEIRLIEVTSLRRGHRPKRIVLVTTLLDPTAYPAEQIAELYLRRWDIEIDFRHLKSAMGMEVLAGKSPDIVRKEIWSYIIGYNLVRRVMWETGVSHDFPPSGLEFQRDAPVAAYLSGPNRMRGELQIGAENMDRDA